MFNSAMNFFKRIGTVKHKFRLQIILDKLNLNPDINQQLSIVVKRGQHKKESKKRNLKNNIADFKKQRLIFETVTMYYDNQQKKYAEKQGEIRVIIHRSNGDKKLAGIIKFDLTNYTQTQIKKQQIQLTKCPSMFKSKLSYQIYFKFLAESNSQGGSQAGNFVSNNGLKLKTQQKIIKNKNENGEQQNIKKIYKKEDLNDFNQEEANNKLTNEQQQQLMRQISNKKKKKEKYKKVYYDAQQNDISKNRSQKIISNSGKNNKEQDLEDKRQEQVEKLMIDEEANEKNGEIKKLQGNRNNTIGQYYKQQINRIQKQKQRIIEQKLNLSLKVEDLTQRLRQKQKELSIVKSQKNGQTSKSQQKYQIQINQLKQKIAESQKYWGAQLIKLQQLKINEVQYKQKFQRLQNQYAQQLKSIKQQYLQCKQQKQKLIKQKRQFQKQKNKKKQLQLKLKQTLDELTKYKLKISSAMNAASQQGDQRLISFLQRKFI